MTKLSIRQMIDSGSWFRCEAERKTQFRMRITAFRPVELAEIDKPENVTREPLSEGCLWLLSFSAVNLGKEGLSTYSVKSSFVIVDDEDCEFKTLLDTYLTCISKFSIETGIRRFSGIAPVLAPKMVANGAAAYLLPEQDFQNYSLKMVGVGTIEEV